MRNANATKLSRRLFLGAAPAAAVPLSAETAPTASFPGVQFYDQQERKEVLDALESRSLFRWYGPATPNKVASFETELARYMGAKYALALTSGTAALHCALTALEVGPGDEVILPAWTWYSCYNAIVLTGALPVFAEVDESFTLDPEDVARKITRNTRAIMVVHLFGSPADMDRILPLARSKNIKVLEDAAQTVGGQYKGRRLGSIGDVGIYSFQISKVITAGEAGALVTSDPAIFERATRFHDLGQLRPGHKAMLNQPGADWFAGLNYRMNEMTGGVMRAQLGKLDMLLGRLRESATSVRHSIAGLRQATLRRLPDPSGDIGIHVAMLLPDKAARDRFVAGLRAEKVTAGPPSGSVILPVVPYIEKKTTPHRLWPSFQSARGKALRYGAGCCSKSLQIFDRALSIPIGPKYGQAQVDAIVRAVRKVDASLPA